jgi:molecular chaperone GrpE
MVKKKSHEERHDEAMPVNEVKENQSSAETEITAQAEPSAEKEAAGKDTSEEELLNKLTEMQDKYLRLSAEFDNYRKRTLREKIDLARSGGETVIVNLLPIIDDFERAMSSMSGTNDCTAIKKGIELIYGKITDFLKQNGVSEIEALNEPFNSDMHEAVTSIAVDDDTLKGKVVDVTQKGYTLNERVIRFPKVVVGE